MKNTVMYSKMEQMVREATCTGMRIPSDHLLRQIAKGTLTDDFSSIMAIIWKRIQKRSNEQPPYKSASSSSERLPKAGQ